MEKKGYESIYEFKGIALKSTLRTKNVERAPKKISINVNRDRCVGCGERVIGCFYKAITLKKRGGVHKPRIMRCVRFMF
ncbi:MAG TPA: hypothetical protein ENH03_00380 [Candidatus Bathyarchaeota archaeon]|nr:hypothetical protein [Candidatus Bathyarchaeota archaeon]